MQITMEPAEAETLKHALTSYLSDLRMEIAGTDKLEFRERLKDEEVTLKKVLEQLQPRE